MGRPLAFTDKICTTDSLKTLIAGWKSEQRKIVFTNGCFDILHVGHVTYLNQAASLGDKLIVGLNTDSSVKRQNKGENRPVNNQEARAIVLSSLEQVDAVVLFDGDTPIELIKLIRPDVLAKGADYDPEETNPSSKKYIVGSDIVKHYSGKVIAIPLVEGFSTTSIINKLK